MSTEAIAIREAVLQRLSVLQDYKTTRGIPIPQAAPADFPALSVFILREQLVPDGDSNAGEPSFILDVTIGVSIARGGNPLDLDALMDTDILSVETLFTDPTFVRRAPGALFESIEGLMLARLFPKDGEKYFAETRVEITFRTRCSFDPVIPDNFAGLNLTASVGDNSAPPAKVQVNVETLP